MQNSHPVHQEKIIRQTTKLALLFTGVYLASAAVILDFSEWAYPIDEESHQGRMVAFGPQPRILLCKPAALDIPGGPSYDGKEWALVLYRPICQIWSALNGRALPASWRE